MRRDARLLVALAGLSTLGCTAWNALLTAGQIVEAAGEAGHAIRRANATPPHPEEPNEETRLAALRDRSRSRLYPPGGPTCAVRIVRTGSRSWQLESCDSVLRCWALTEGYACEPVLPPGAAQL